MHSTPQFLDAAAEPEQLLFGDAVVLRVSRLHIGLFELLEPCAIDARVARLGINQTHIDTFGLGAEKAEIMDVLG